LRATRESLPGLKRPTIVLAVVAEPAVGVPPRREEDRRLSRRRARHPLINEEKPTREAPRQEGRPVAEYLAR
jgi:hypothetical protein